LNHARACRSPERAALQCSEPAGPHRRPPC